MDKGSFFYLFYLKIPQEDLNLHTTEESNPHIWSTRNVSIALFYDKPNPNSMGSFSLCDSRRVSGL